MAEFDNIIGQKCDKAINLLKEHKYNNIEIISNAKNDNGDLVVCKAFEKNEKIVLICGKFDLEVKGK